MDVTPGKALKYIVGVGIELDALQSKTAIITNRLRARMLILCTENLTETLTCTTHFLIAGDTERCPLFVAVELAEISAPSLHSDVLLEIELALRTGTCPVQSIRELPL